MALCGDCKRFINPNYIPGMLDKPAEDRKVPCEKGKVVQSLDLCCEEYDGPRIDGYNYPKKSKLKLRFRGGRNETTQEHSVLSVVGNDQTGNEKGSSNLPPPTKPKQFTLF